MRTRCWRASWARTRSRMSSLGWITHRSLPTWILRRPPTQILRKKMTTKMRMMMARMTMRKVTLMMTSTEGVFALDDEDDDDGEDDEDDDLPSWSNLETVNSCHPLYFAKMIVETATKSNIDWLDRPPASLVVEGQLRPAFAEESTMVAKHLSSDEPQKDKKESGATFFKVEVLSIELITAYGTEPKVKIEEYRKARPDIIAHSAPNIISRLRAGGDKITQALKSLCWRCKAIQVEEAAVIGVDCLGFDLRVCSGTQVQTLRFAFPTKATSEFSAEKQIHELLFPRNTHQEGQSPQARHKY
ncbi:hypothetical protein PVAP13_8NG132000 [Panicum virgatum]|uniref:Uncharacterized protein n=1 Tax=Panicum virgatum TaxID=38727 RepID=A0A8T0P7D8_PANVG|nr:hypothetical protein PVAP13_8NG132000 [Panicum virgatum]